MLKKSIKKSFLRFFLILVIFVGSSTHSFAFLSLGISGNSSSTNSGLESERDVSVSGSISVDLGSYFRVGYTHRQQAETKSGYKIYQDDASDAVLLEVFNERTDSTIKSLDLTLVLYQGRILVPFIFGGIAWKSYDVTESSAIRGNRKYSIPQHQTWNGGGGLAITLTERFSLKISKTFSPGKIYDVDESANQIVAVRRITDSYTQFGITYRL